MTQRFKTAPKESVQAAKVPSQLEMELSDLKPEAITWLSNGDEESKAMMATYYKDERKVSVVHENGDLEESSIRVMIANRDYVGQGKFLLLLDNNKFYMTDSLNSNHLMYNQEVGYEVHQLKAKIGDLLSLVTDHKDSLVDAVNDLAHYTSTGHHLVRVIDYLVENENQLPTKADDMTICFRTDRRRFYYYSEALEAWVSLPKGWSKLTYIARNDEELAVPCEIGEKIGVLTEDKTYQAREKNGGLTWEEVKVVDEIGDEYMVQEIIAKGKTGTGSLILTETGWHFIFNK